ncbi:MAG: DinB family protein [Flavisolibacter sp.]
MINKEQVLSDLDRSTDELIQQLLSCDEKDFNKSPGDNRWTVAMVAQHILILETQVNWAFQKAVKTDRAVDGKLLFVTKGLDNLDKKFVAPDFIVPTTDDKDRHELLDAIKKQRNILRQIIQTTDLEETPTYKHPVIGDMTRLEWIYFNIHHAQRHLRQLQRAASSEK